MKAHFKSFAISSCMLLWASAALGNEGDTYAPTSYFELIGGYSTYKSALLSSNDTSTSVSYGLGVWAGHDKSLGMKLERSSSTFNFALNSSKLAQNWQDLHFLYRLGVARLGAVISSSSYTVSAPPDSDGDGKPDDSLAAVEYIDVVTNGYGVSAGLSIPLGRVSLLESNFIYVLSAAGRQKAAAADADTATVTASQRVSSIGPRMEFNIGGRFALTRNVLSALCGFRYNSYTITVDNTAKADVMTSTYVGLATAWDF
ncbi:MAG: hypothetical protein NTY08_11810 [Proteobacteria bacterium]|nr:hypothetical protein [Pseudomonadota bacterium]